jgi:hypothetical protein
MVRNCNFDNIPRVEPQGWFEEGVSVVCKAWSIIRTPVEIESDGEITISTVESEGYNEGIIVPIEHIEGFEPSDVEPLTAE